MIKIKVLELAQKHRFTIQLIHNETGLSRSTISEIFKGGVKRIDLDTLDTLLIFFNKYIPCKISDILEYIPNE